MVGERNNILYMFGVCFAFFALSAKGWGGLNSLAKSPQNQKGHNFYCVHQIYSNIAECIAINVLKHV